MELQEDLQNIREEAHTKSLANDFGKQLLAWAAFLIALLVLFWFFAPDRYWYSFRYSIPNSSVYVEDRPKDCDFIHAPIGDKACTYTKTVWLTKENGRIIGVSVKWKRVSR